MTVQRLRASQECNVRCDIHIQLKPSAVLCVHNCYSVTLKISYFFAMLSLSFSLVFSATIVVPLHTIQFFRLEMRLSASVA